MAEVARIAGTSTQTVSRVLRDHPHVSEYTRQRVLDAVHQTGYRRTSLARALTSGRTMTIGIVTYESDSLYARSAIVLGVQRAARDHGYSMSSAGTTSLSSAAIGQAIARLREQSVDGLVIAVPVEDDPDLMALTDGVPTVVVDGLGALSDEVVAVDQVAAGRMATEHLLALGHTSIWHVAGPSAWTDSARRIEGWTAALEDAGRPVSPVLYGDWSPSSGYRNGQVIARLPDASAVFVASDEMAFGLIRALKDMGRRIPEDVSVVGMDDIALAEYFDPPLTTVRQPFQYLGRSAVQHVLALIDDPDTKPESLWIKPELIVRASTAPPTS
jgi:DNA-binding LacI/PurR family transcriptional regulator